MAIFTYLLFSLFCCGHCLSMTTKLVENIIVKLGESLFELPLFSRENCVKFTISVQAMTGFYTTTWRRKLCMRAHECNTIVSRKHVGHRTLVNIPFHSCYAATAHSQWVPGKGVRMPISWWLQVHAYLSGRSEIDSHDSHAESVTVLSSKLLPNPKIRSSRTKPYDILCSKWLLHLAGACIGESVTFWSQFMCVA